MFERGRPHRAGPQVDAVVFLHAFGRAGKGMLTAKVRQHSLQAPGPTSGGNPQTLGQWTQIALRWTAPNTILNLHQPENAPPLQRFFLRLTTVGSSVRNSRLTRCSAVLAHRVIVQCPS